MELIWLVILLVTSSECARILVIQPVPGKGHLIVTEPLFEELAARGHHLTVVTSFPHTPAVPNLREIDVSEETEAKKWFGNVSVDFIREQMPNQFKSAWFMLDVGSNMCEAVYSNSEVKEILNSNEKFDLVITEIFTSDCFAPFAAKLNASLVSVATSCALPWMADRLGLPDNPAYVPNYFVDVGPSMSFGERVYNTVFLVYTKLLYHFLAMPKAQAVADKYFGKSVPPVADVVRNTSLVLVNSYFSLTGSRPLTPNVIEVGGIHMRNTTKPVPEDVQRILDSSSQGVIVVSFGTMVRVATLPQGVIRALLATFSNIPQTVLFKYEEELSGVPENVIIRKWLPQREIMAHKNVKAILGHGGLASTIEAVYFGKPLIGVPFFSDQFLNIQTIVRHGAGVLLGLDDISEKTLNSALHQVLNDPKYTQNARRLSAQFRDRPRTPLQTAVYWVEYVLRHGGAPHLRPASVDLHLGQYLLLDILLTLLGALAAVVILLHGVFRLFSKDREKQHAKKVD